jgi:hypothetical protein
MGRPDPDAPSMLDFEGLVLRAQLDGAVVRREVYWRAGMDVPLETAAVGMRDESLLPPDSPSDAASRILFTSDFPWALFMDELLEKP